MPILRTNRNSCPWQFNLQKKILILIIIQINVHKAVSHLRYYAHTAKCGKTLLHYTSTYVHTNIHLYIYL